MSAEPASRTGATDPEPAIRPVADANRSEPVRVSLADTRERRYRVRVFFGIASFRAHVTGGPFLTDAHAIDHARRVVREQHQPAGRFHRGEVVSA